MKYATLDSVFLKLEEVSENEFNRLKEKQIQFFGRCFTVFSETKDTTVLLPVAHIAIQNSEALTPKVTFRVRPEHYGYAPEDFNTIEEAAKRCNDRNSVRPIQHEEGKFYRGDNCKLQKVSTLIEDITR